MSVAKQTILKAGFFAAIISLGAFASGCGNDAKKEEATAPKTEVQTPKMETAVDTAVEAVNDAVDTAKETVSDAVDTAGEVVSDVVDATTEATTEAVDTATEAVTDAVDTATEAVNDVVDAPATEEAMPEMPAMPEVPVEGAN